MMDMKLSSDSQYQKMATYRSVRSMLDLFYALKLSRKDLRVLVGLLTVHADLNRHVTFMQVCTDELCPLCQEVEETTLHLLGKCCALINQRLEILGSHYLDYEDLAILHWRSLLRLAKVSKRF